MRRAFFIEIFLAGMVPALVTSCGAKSAATSGTRSLTADNSLAQTVTHTVLGTTESCPQYSRDTSSCQSARESLGLSGNWLSFSCNVVEGLVDGSGNSVSSYAAATYVTLTTSNLPDYSSNYYPTSGSYSFTAYGETVTGDFSSLYTAFTPPFPDPGTIGAVTVTLKIPIAPSQAPAKSETMAMGIVGMAVNGVVLYDSVAAQTDNIFAEGGSFDACGGHPAGTEYHYHSEPYSISYDDNHLIGVMRDGFFVYGRKDSDGSTPGSLAAIGSATNGDLYVYGGHVGADPVTGSGNTFHYHLTEWEGCYHESGRTRSADDGATNDANNSPNGTTEGCGGNWMDTWLVTGHGNGGVFQTIPSGLNGQSPSQTATAIRYYYGTPGGCTSTNATDCH